MPSNDARRNLLPKAPIESFWDALWLGIYRHTTKALLGLGTQVYKRLECESGRHDVVQRWSWLGYYEKQRTKIQQDQNTHVYKSLEIKGSSDDVAHVTRRARGEGGIL